MAVYTDDPRLVSYWRMEEGTGLTRVDSVGLNDLTDSGNVAQSADHREGSFSADCELDTPSYLYINDVDQTRLDMNGKDTISIVAWVKLESYPGYMALVSKYSTSDNKRSYYLLVDSAQFIRMYASADGVATDKAYGAITLNVGTWYHVAGVCNGTDIRVYVNGVLDDGPGSDNPVAHVGNIFQSDRDFVIGGRADAFGDYDGLLDAVAVFDGELSATDVSYIYNNGIPDPPSPSSDPECGLAGLGAMTGLAGIMGV